jgi:hypothetical protein
MTDIATRLRQTRANMLGTEDEQHYWDCHEAAAEIERLRLWGRLTSAEREAVIVASIELQALSMSETNHSDALRSILARLP